MNEEETIAKMLSKLAKTHPYVGETQTAFDDRARRRCEAATQVDLVKAVGREAVIKAATGFPARAYSVFETAAGTGADRTAAKLGRLKFMRRPVLLGVIKVSWRALSGRSRS